MVLMSYCRQQMKKLFIIIALISVFTTNSFAEVYKMMNCLPNAKHIAKSWGPTNVEIDTSDKSILWFDKKYNYLSGDAKTGFLRVQKPFASDDKASYAEITFNPSTSKIDYKVYTKNIWQKSARYDPSVSEMFSLVCDKSTIPENTAKGSKVEIASMIERSKDTCKSLGFKEGTEKFADCSLKLYSQSVQLAAEQNKTVVMQPQSSGSNVMTIYDPVRDSRALMKQGQRMLSGACTLGINC